MLPEQSSGAKARHSVFILNDEARGSTAIDPSRRMQIQLIDRFESLRPYASRWNQLLAASRSNSIFLTWEWIEPWWQVFGEELELMVLVAEDEGRLIGIAPFMRGPFPGSGSRAVRAVMFLGQGGDTLAEYLDLIVEPGREAAITGAFVDYLCGPLRHRWDALLLERVSADSPNARHLKARLNGHGLSVSTRNELPAPYLPLPDSMDALLASKSANFRYQYRRNLRRLRASGTARFLVAGRDLSLTAALDLLAELNRERWQEAGASFRTDRYRRFHAALAQRLHERGWLWLAILTIDGEPIAARYDFVYGGKVWCIQGGWKPSHRNLHPGMIMTGEIIAWAIDQDLGEYDFLAGEDHYKRRWANVQRTLVDLESFNTTTLRGRVWPWLRSLKHALSLPTADETERL
jgi:CelD/BcsL family acetyltransferase involved in cellulose biosynthesis